MNEGTAQAPSKPEEAPLYFRTMTELEVKLKELKKEEEEVVKKRDNALALFVVEGGDSAHVSPRYQELKKDKDKLDSDLNSIRAQITKVSDAIKRISATKN